MVSGILRNTVVLCSLSFVFPFPELMMMSIANTYGTQSRRGR
jgi:hypothetical protein